MRRDVLTWLGPLTGIALAGWLVMSFLVAPTERVMGDVQRIFYLHVPSAWGGMLAFGIVFVASIAYLLRRKPDWDHLAHAAAEVGVVLTTIALVTGSFWARPVWNTWWTWDPRLTTTLIMWFVYVAYLMLRGALNPGEQGPRLASVLGIIGFLNVPLVYYSARIWRTIHPIIEDPSMDLNPVMHQALLSGVAAFTLLVICLTVFRRRLKRLQAAVDYYKYEAVSRTAGQMEELSQ